MRSLLKLFGLIMLLGLINGCGKDDPVVENDEELITTVRLTFSPEDGSAAVVFEYKDLDGDGGNAPIITNGILKKAGHYKADLSLLNESVNPAENITNEIKNEAASHQVFYTFSNGLGVDWAYLDEDKNGAPLGLNIHVYTPNSGTGTLIVTLRHEPDKKATGATQGDPSQAGGDTDAEVLFNISVQ